LIMGRSIRLNCHAVVDSLASRFRTVVAFHRPPRAVLIPLRFSAAAIWCREASPSANCLITGRMFAA
jgi:hypothetical protein